jgi:hypothetical protein
MRQAESAYLQEEARYRGARPRIKAVLSPFELDCGLAPGSGDFEETVYGGAPGKLAMAGGYRTAGSWTSPVIQAFSPYLDQAMAAWEEPAGHMEVEVRLRTGETPAALAQAPLVQLWSGDAVELARYFQVRVDFQETIRAWAVDDLGDADSFTAYAVDQAPDGGYESRAVAGPACLAGFSLTGALAVPEQEIVDPGGLRVELSRDFGELRTADHALLLDNRLGLWLPRAANTCFPDPDWTKKQLALYHGWELADGTVAWQMLYRGVVQDLAGMAHGWREPHRVRLESLDAVLVGLRQKIGVPTATGERQPFMRGSYRARGELIKVVSAAVGDAAKTGSGSASLQILGTYRGDYPQDYLLEVASGGEVGGGAFRWSRTGGQSWEQTGLETAGAEAPVDLEQGLTVFWEPGIGPDLVAGDRWAFTAQPPVYHYQVFGAPFEAVTAIYLNGEATTDRVSADPLSGVVQVTGRSAAVAARVVKDRTTHPVDILTDIFGAVGLDQFVDQDAFALAKGLTPEYSIGVRFENCPAAQAIREIVRRCLYDLWIDFGEIKIEAYLGEDGRP